MHKEVDAKQLQFQSEQKTLNTFFCYQDTLRLLFLVQIILALLISSSNCERAFSALNRINTMDFNGSCHVFFIASKLYGPCINATIMSRPQTLSWTLGFYVMIGGSVERLHLFLIDSDFVL